LQQTNQLTGHTMEPNEIEAAKQAAAAATAAQKEATAAARTAEKAAKKAEREATKAAKKESENAVKEAAKTAKAAAKAAKDAEKASSVVPAMPSQNGVTRPKTGTLCAKVWDICDTTSNELRQPAPVENVMARALAAGLQPATIRTQYAHWKKFNGLAGRIAMPVAAPVVPVEGEVEPAAA
jgi:multidrug efflux pump subunit AcrA (membrane-fusion protein)